jgi:predicted AlkP superfamily pyrophosphatase or phosphodiesterase
MAIPSNFASLTQFAATISNIIGIAPPYEADAPLERFSEMIKSSLSSPIERVLIHNPDAMAMWLYQKYFEEFAPLIKHTKWIVPLKSPMPPLTPICFATMYTGVLPEVHGIQNYSKPILKTDSLFDALIRAGKKVAFVARTDSSMSKIYVGKDLDYFIYDTDEEVKNKAIELIKEDKHDFLIVYTMEYDALIHKVGPEVPEAMQQLKNQIRIADELGTAISREWAKYSYLFTVSTDHGMHLYDDSYGVHGMDITDDRDIFHFFGVNEKFIK